jgi:hypothetical protein
VFITNDDRGLTFNKKRMGRTLLCSKQRLGDHCFKNVVEAKARELTATLPLFPYFHGIDYTEMDKRY